MANSVVRPHIPEEELHAYCDGELSATQRVEIAEHLLGCLICHSQHAMVEAVRLRATTLLSIAVPLNIRTGAGVLSFLTMTTIFGTPVDVTLSELCVESFFPADKTTAATLRAAAASFT